MRRVEVSLLTLNYLLIYYFQCYWTFECETSIFKGCFHTCFANGIVVGRTYTKLYAWDFSVATKMFCSTENILLISAQFSFWNCNTFLINCMFALCLVLFLWYLYILIFIVQPNGSQFTIYNNYSRRMICGIDVVCIKAMMVFMSNQYSVESFYHILCL